MDRDECSLGASQLRPWSAIVELKDLLEPTQVGGPRFFPKFRFTINLIMRSSGLDPRGCAMSSFTGLLKRFPSCFCPYISIRGLCTAVATEDGGRDEGAYVSERIQHQTLLAGLSFLKGDAHSLRENVSRRAAAANIDKLVGKNPCMHIAKISLPITNLTHI